MIFFRNYLIAIINNSYHVNEEILSFINIIDILLRKTLNYTSFIIINHRRQFGKLYNAIWTAWSTVTQFYRKRTSDKFEKEDVVSVTGAL